MLKFRKINLEDKQLIESFFEGSEDISCENTFVNLYVWQGAYNNMICIENGTLFIKYGEGADTSFRLPVGGDLEWGLKAIMEYCGNKPPVFWSPVGESFHRLPNWFKSMYDVIPTRDGFDYIYFQKDLSRLEGKKYHSKRNHISAFSKAYSWRYERITNANISAVEKCAEEWYAANSDRADKYMLCEKQGVKLMLQNMESLNIIGGAIFIENKAVAFTLGTPVSSEVFDICTEKALPLFATAYTVINREFALNELGEYKYLNREDDMGLEGLRRAKLSYKPAILLEKYALYPKHPLSRIYNESFGEDEFKSLLFYKCEPYLKALDAEGETVSILFSLPCEIEAEGRQLPAEYIYAAATKKSERKKGYMEKLLKSVLKEDGIFILRPANDGLIAYYEKFGFRKFTATDTEKGGLSLIPKEGFAALAEGEETAEGEFTLMALNSPVNLENIYFPYSMP